MAVVVVAAATTAIIIMIAITSTTTITVIDIIGVITIAVTSWPTTLAARCTAAAIVATRIH